MVQAVGRSSPWLGELASRQRGIERRRRGRVYEAKLTPPTEHVFV